MLYFVTQFQIFLLIFVRMSSMIVIAPFFSSGIIPFRNKAAFSFMITLVIFPVVNKSGYTLTSDMSVLFLLILKEISIGLIIGFLVSIIFAAFQLSGQFFAVQIGFGINEVLDPVAQVSIPLIGQLKNLIALLVLLAMNGHHMMIEAVYRSYELVPVFSYTKSAAGTFVKLFVASFSGMFVVALKIAMPIVGTIFLVSLSMGILAKAAPQMNILMLGFPFKIIVAFGVLVVISPMIIRIMRVSLERSFNTLNKLLMSWPM
jgi:flagellar biosynthesis protein FliR